MKKIIFGAGNYGRMACEYYGESQIAYFVDNNPEKIGKKCCGKEILSFEKYLALWKEYDLVVAVRAYAQVSEQLRSAGIDKYIYFSPQFQNVLEHIGNCGIDGTKKIGLYGVDRQTVLLLRTIYYSGVPEKNIYIIKDNKDDEDLFPELQCISLSEAAETVGIVIIASPMRSYILQAKAKFLTKAGISIVNPFIPQGFYETKDVIFNPYLGIEKDISESEWNKMNKQNLIIDEINEYADELNRLQPLFDYIELETVNRCNGTCNFCPVSAAHDIREKKYMEERLFQKIINELADINYSGHIALFSNNEPFLDNRILQFHKYARERLRLARFHLFTNGSLLTLDKFIELMNYLDELVIDNYNQKLELTENSRIIAKYCDEHEELKKKVTIVLRKPSEILTSRGGDAPNRQDIITYPDAKCVLPFRQMIVRPDGKLSLCCNDPYGKITLGDLNEESVVEAWYGEGYRAVREKIVKGREYISNCKKCDTFYIY